MSETTALNIVNPNLQFKKVSLVEPSGYYYLHIAAEVDKSFLPFFLTSSKKKKELIKKCQLFCGILDQEKNIESAVVF